MNGALANHLWQSTWFAVGAAALAFACRKNRAQVRYRLWLSASLKFFAPFALLIALGNQVRWIAPARAAVTPAVSSAILQISEPVGQPAPLPPVSPERQTGSGMALAGLWGCGFVAVVAMRMRGWARIRSALRNSIPAGIAAPMEVRVSSGLMEPGVVGWRHPVLLLPKGLLERLTPGQFQAVLAHELCHVRRRDNVFAFVHMLVEALFWFHPMVWWIGARLVEERERACDEEVIRLGNEPRIYAAGIVNVCKNYVESPLSCVAGVTGAGVKRRIHAILSGRIALELSRSKKAALSLAGVAAVVIPIAVGVLRAPAMRAQSAAAGFEVVSIKRCTGDEGTTGGRKDIRKKGGGGPESSPGRLSTGCMTVADLIHQAYVVYARGHMYRQPWMPRASGGPSWIDSETYAIDARAEGNPAVGTMMGPMLQRLLEDRFRLKIHRESREVPVYFLTVAKGGPKLHPFQQGSCVAIDYTNFTPAEAGREGRCKSAFIRMLSPAHIEGPAIGMDYFSKLLMLVVERPIIDRTGLSGLFDFHLDFAPDENTAQPPPIEGSKPPVAGEPAGPSIFAGIQQQLGLKLEPGRGPQDFFVIDHIERPAGN